MKTPTKSRNLEQGCAKNRTSASVWTDEKSAWGELVVDLGPVIDPQVSIFVTAVLSLYQPRHQTSMDHAADVRLNLTQNKQL